MFYLRWSGLGPLSIFIGFFSWAGVLWLGIKMHVEAYVASAGGLLLGALLNWVLGRWANRDGVRHTLYGAPMQQWSAFMIFLALVLLYAAYLSAN